MPTNQHEDVLNDVVRDTNAIKYKFAKNCEKYIREDKQSYIQTDSETLESIISSLKSIIPDAYNIVLNEDNEIVFIDIFEVVSSHQFRKKKASLVCGLARNLDIIEIQLRLFIIDALSYHAVEIYPFYLYNTIENSKTNWVDFRPDVARSFSLKDYSIGKYRLGCRNQK